MSEDIVISVENLSKAYPIYAKPFDILRETITGKRCHDLFWALKDISFTIKSKQRVGVIGSNGSGKSTLLKIITGNLPPTSGSIKVNGQISAMLSLASSLNPEETGLNNIRFNLILNGCKPSEVARLTEEIIEFTELGPFIYSPVKTYSTGMNARLAFAITTSIKPEILVVDEVLSVGDAYFVGKATKRMIDLCEQGKALIFVSHSTSSVQMLCDTVIWLDNGSIRNMGLAEHIIKQYEEDYVKREDETTRAGNIARKNNTETNLQVSDIEQVNIGRVRLVSQEKSGIFKDTHYIRKITLSGESIETQNIHLTVVDINQEDIVACLDLLNSEWGRLYSKDGDDCRILRAQSGKNKGGHILIKRPFTIPGIWKFKMTIETISILQTECLLVEFINYKIGNWQQADVIHRETLKDGWQKVTAYLEIPQVDDEQYKQALIKIEQDNKPNIEIKDVSVWVNGETTHCVNERQPFEVRVRVFANCLTPVSDVIIKIYRSDGVYVFWQSSGVIGMNLYNLDDEVTVCFLFENNYFANGEYAVSAICANGWDVVHNFPYSEVFDRKINACKFYVQREFELVMFGQINMRVPVKLIKNQEELS